MLTKSRFSLLVLAACTATSLAASLAAPVAAHAQATPVPPPAAPPSIGLDVGSLAPDFSLTASTQAGTRATPLRLSELRGQVVVIAFFPKARTKGCTVQLETYRDQYATLFNDGKGVTVLAVSTDDASTQQSWAAEAKFPVTLVSDPDAVAGKAYDVKYPVLNIHRRVLFVIDREGRIVHVMRPFRELSADAYTELGDAVRRALAP